MGLCNSLVTGKLFQGKLGRHSRDRGLNMTLTCFGYQYHSWQSRRTSCSTPTNRHGLKEKENKYNKKECRFTMHYSKHYAECWNPFIERKCRGLGLYLETSASLFYSFLFLFRPNALSEIFNYLFVTFPVLSAHWYLLYKFNIHWLRNKIPNRNCSIKRAFLELNVHENNDKSARKIMTLYQEQCIEDRQLFT